MRTPPHAVRDALRRAAWRLIAVLAFGGSLACIAIAVGTRDLESYETAFFSLNRGSAVETVSVLGQPVHTLSLGLGVRLPLHGNLGASPAAIVAPYLPEPVTYAILLSLAIAAAVLLVCHALEPVCGRVLAWLAAGLLFCSVPMVNYTIYDDWPETAVTYCVFVGAVFAPHAMLAVLHPARSRAAGAMAALSVAATVAALVALAHPGYWLLVAAALVLAALLALCRTEYPWHSRVTVVATLAVVSLVAVGLASFDILRDYQATAAGGDTDRAVDSFAEDVLATNVFPSEIDARVPFSYLVLAVVSIVVAIASPHSHLRLIIAGGACASIALAFGTTMLSPRGAVPALAPSSSWALRDPAGAFAVLSGAWAAAATRRAFADGRRTAVRWIAVGALAIAALQGPVYVVRLVTPEITNEQAWTRDTTAPEDRARRRGLTPDRVPTGTRLALWPGVRQSMRGSRMPSTHFADAGYLLVTAWTKQRTMRGLIEPNGVLFNQTIEPSARVLCDERAVRFLQLRHLLRPADVEPCAPWSPIPELRVDDALDVDVAREVNDRIWALPAGRLDEPTSRKPALSDDSELLAALVALPGTSLNIDPPTVALRFDDPEVARGQTLVLPVAHDTAWRSSAGQLRDVGGLLALTGVDQSHVALTFVPDGVAVLRALALALAQLFALAGLLGLVLAFN
jgi:hypothetical protein